jgi:hypothetical protein
MTAAAELITVLLVDDHAVVREGYRRLLEREPLAHPAPRLRHPGQRHAHGCVRGRVFETIEVRGNF